MLLKKKALLRNLKNFTINFGPLHPVAHGVSKSVFQFGREVIKSAYAHIGFLHSGAEKLIEYKNYLQALQDFDPFDYISTMFLMNINECLNFGVFLVCVAMLCLRRYIFDEKGSYLLSSFLEIIFFPWYVSFSYLSPERIFSSMYFMLELLIVYSYPWMVGALKWNIISYVKEIRHSVYAIIPNPYIDSDISIAAENGPEKHKKPDLEQKEKDALEWEDARDFFILGVGFAFLALSVVLYFKN